MGRLLFVGKHGREAVARDDELLLRAFLGISLSSHPFHVYSLQLQVNSNCAFIPVTGTEKRVLCLGDTVPDGLRKRLHPAPSQLN